MSNEAQLTRHVLVFGNGIGRSISDADYQLPNAMAAVWNEPDGLNARQKALIQRCLSPEVIEKVPTHEHQLAGLQEIVAACDRILQAEGDTQEGWLNPTGKEFPAAIRSYVHRIACKFHTGHRLPSDFAQSLRDFILESRSHVATLNYDDLLYRAFIRTPVMKGYDCLNDGFISQVFKVENLDRLADTRRQSWYLHLHGSPLYYEPEPGTIKKAPLANIDLIQGDSSGHIVLTSANHKTSIIESSEILSEYWRRFKEAINESEAITLFGYGGADDHLNALVKLSGKQVKIVERNSDNALARKEFWQPKVGDHDLIQLADILTFTDWKRL